MGFIPADSPAGPAVRLWDHCLMIFTAHIHPYTYRNCRVLKYACGLCGSLFTINMLFQRDGLHSVHITERLTGIHISQRGALSELQGSRLFIIFLSGNSFSSTTQTWNVTTAAENQDRLISSSQQKLQGAGLVPLLILLIVLSQLKRPKS